MGIHACTHTHAGKLKAQEPVPSGAWLQLHNDVGVVAESEGSSSAGVNVQIQPCETQK